MGQAPRRRREIRRLGSISGVQTTVRSRPPWPGIEAVPCNVQVLGSSTALCREETETSAVSGKIVYPARPRPSARHKAAEQAARWRLYAAIPSVARECCRRRAEG